MSIRNALKLSPFIVLTLMNLVSLSARAEGGTSGGGGDAATEMRIDEIRADIVKWISEGDGSELVLPEGMTYAQYRDAMIPQLQKHAVVIGAVTSAEEAATQDPELKVLVRGQPKTCRGFLSARDMRRHILCNAERLKATSESEQYALIHHEYAGLAMVEKNVGASSDYAISQQVTDYLVPQTVLKLAVKKPAPVVTAEEVPQLVGVVRSIWNAMKKNKILIPQNIMTGITARSDYGLFQIRIKTQLVQGKDREGQNYDFLPVWIAVAFDPLHPGELAFARLHAAGVANDFRWDGGESKVRLLEGSAVIGLDGTTRSRVTGANFLGVEIQQYLNIDMKGQYQLYLRGGFNLAASGDTMRTLDLDDESNSALLGEVGLRLFKQLTIRGKARGTAYTTKLSEGEIKLTDPSLEGGAVAYGGGVDWQVRKNVKVFGNFTKVDTSSLKNNEGRSSVSGGTAGILINFW